MPNADHLKPSIDPKCLHHWEDLVRGKKMTRLGLDVHRSTHLKMQAWHMGKRFEGRHRLGEDLCQCECQNPERNTIPDAETTDQRRMCNSEQWCMSTFQGDKRQLGWRGTCVTAQPRTSEELEEVSACHREN